jgi:prepilin-type N-terminal cleavage/methylation domain-containing protein
MKYNKFQKGFTLIELLVVISIISLLSSIVFASVASAKEKAQKVVVSQTIRSYKYSFDAFYLDNGYYPTPTNPNGGQYCLGSSVCSVGFDDPPLDTQLRPYYPGLPGIYLGVTYTCYGTPDANNKCTQYVIFWYLPNTPYGICPNGTFSTGGGTVVNGTFYLLCGASSGKYP